MEIKKIAAIAVGAAALTAGVQFSLAYINRVQIKHIMEAEALDARRMNTSEEQLVSRIVERAEQSAIEISEDITFTVEGLNKPKEDLVVTADYIQPVNLFVTKVPLKMHIVAAAETPFE